MFDKLKQFKDLRNQAKALQEELGKQVEVAETFGGKIKMTMDGNLQILSLSIDENALEASNKQKIEQGVIEAHKDVLKKIQRTMAIKMKEMGGLPKIPGLN